MKHLVKPECRVGKCTFIQVSDNLWLCPHASYGTASYYKGAVEEARKILERAGGYNAVLARLQAEKQERIEKAREARKNMLEDKYARLGVRYD